MCHNSQCHYLSCCYPCHVNSITMCRLLFFTATKSRVIQPCSSSRHAGPGTPCTLRQPRLGLVLVRSGPARLEPRAYPSTAAPRRKTPVAACRLLFPISSRAHQTTSVKHHFHTSSLSLNLTMIHPPDQQSATFSNLAHDTAC